MMGARQVAQEALFYEFSHVPAGQVLRAIDGFSRRRASPEPRHWIYRARTNGTP
jgi:hypothetical protein